MVLDYINPGPDTFLNKRIVIENIDTIQALLQPYAMKKNNLSYRKAGGLLYLDVPELMENCPPLAEWLEKNSIKVSKAVCIDVPPFVGYRQQRIHSDPMRNALALNFPIQGCVDPKVWTSLYRIVDGKPPSLFTITDHKGATDKVIKAGFFEMDRAKEVSRFQYIDNNPVLLNARVPHSVYNMTALNRISCSLRFSEDPIHLCG